MKFFWQKSKQVQSTEEPKPSYPPPWSQRKDCIRWLHNLAKDDLNMLISVIAVEAEIKKQDYNLYHKIRQCENPDLQLRCRGYEVIFGGELSPKKLKSLN